MDALQHLDLLGRYDRTINLRTAVRRAVESGARVLDAGCGSGLLSFWAAEAGASEVVAVDLEGVELARSLAEENGLAGRISFKEGDLWDANLVHGQEAFDVVVAMVYLNDPRRDEARSRLAYALRDRYLRAGGTMIPQRVRYRAAACDWPAQDHGTRQQRVAARVADLQGRYGFSFGALERAVANRPWKPWFPERGWDGRLILDGAKLLSEPGNYVEVDYATEPAVYPERFEIAITRPGVFNTLLWTQELWFEDQLLFANESVSWATRACFVEGGEKCVVQTGDEWRRSNLVGIIGAEY